MPANAHRYWYREMGEQQCVADLLKIRIRSLPISSLPLLVLLHWDIGNDGEPHCACVAGAASRWERWCTLPTELRYMSSAWQKLGTQLWHNLETTGCVGGVTHTVLSFSVMALSGGVWGPSGAPEGASAIIGKVKNNICVIWLILFQSSDRKTNNDPRDESVAPFLYWGIHNVQIIVVVDAKHGAELNQIQIKDL